MPQQFLCVAHEKLFGGVKKRIALEFDLSGIVKMEEREGRKAESIVAEIKFEKVLKTTDGIGNLIDCIVCEIERGERRERGEIFGGKTDDVVVREIQDAEGCESGKRSKIKVCD